MKNILKKATVKSVIIGAVALLFLVAGILLFTLQVSEQTKEAEKAVIVTPDFRSFVPSGKTIEQLGGWQKLTPPDGEPFYVYSDSIDSVPIAVTQQKLPASFVNDPTSNLASLAEAYSATNSFEVEGTKVYIGNSSKGPQSVLLSKGSVLILIKSENVITDDAWKAYIASLS